MRINLRNFFVDTGFLAKDNLIPTLLILIIFFGFFLRIYKLGDSSYWIDEGFTIMQSQAIAKHGYPLLNSGNIEFKDILFPYIISPIVKFTKNPFWLRLVPVIFGTISLHIIFLLGKELFNCNVGLISSFLLSFSYWHIAWSRQVRSYVILVFFTLLAVLFLAKNERENKSKYIASAFLFVILAFFSKSSGILFFIPFIVYLFYKKHYRTGTLSLVVFLILVYFFRHLFYNAFNLSLVNYFTYYFFGYFWKYFGIIFVLGLVGAVLAFKNEKLKRSTIFFILLSIIIAVIFFSFFVYVNQRRYLFFIIPFILLAAAYVINYLFQSKIKSIVSFIILIIILDVFFWHSLSFWPKSFYALEEYTPQPNFSLAYEKISKSIKEKDFIISPYPYLDLIYLNKSDYYIPISYTGRPEDNKNSNREYYSGAKRLWGKEKLEKLRQRSDIYILLDEMAVARVSQNLQDYIKINGQIFFENYNYQPITVYKMPKIRGGQQ